MYSRLPRASLRSVGRSKASTRTSPRLYSVCMPVGAALIASNLTSLGGAALPKSPDSATTTGGGGGGGGPAGGGAAGGGASGD
eukprot:4048246-Prymnesium_polylepis.1